MRIAPQIKTGSINFNGVWQITFDPYRVEVEVHRVAITGPPSSTMQVFIEDIFTDITYHGDINSNDLTNPYYIAKGQQLMFVWNTGQGNPPVATIWIKNIGPF
ncbi:MAG: hypothetical protein ACREHG_10165 [Candidatus Saccharimonadales bacterium]